MPGTITDILKGIDTQWEAALSHQFLDSIKTGEISRQQFNAWLVQDYLFLRGFVRFAASVVCSAPEKDLDVLVSGLGALDAELSWFRSKAAERGLDLKHTGMHPTCQTYRSFLEELHTAPYAIKAVAFWAIEAVYNGAWGRLRGQVAAQYAEFVERWGHPGYGEYVSDLEVAANEALAQEGPDVAAAAAGVVAEVARLEVAVWEVACSGEGAEGAVSGA